MNTHKINLLCGRSTARVRLDALTACSLTAHPAANGDNTGEIKAARKELATLSHMPMAQDKCTLEQAFPIRTKVYGTTFTLLYGTYKSFGVEGT